MKRLTSLIGLTPRETLAGLLIFVGFCLTLSQPNDLSTVTWISFLPNLGGLALWAIAARVWRGGENKRPSVNLDAPCGRAWEKTRSKPHALATSPTRFADPLPQDRAISPLQLGEVGDRMSTGEVLGHMRVPYILKDVNNTGIPHEEEAKWSPASAGRLFGQLNSDRHGSTAATAVVGGMGRSDGSVSMPHVLSRPTIIKGVR